MISDYTLPFHYFGGIPTTGTTTDSQPAVKFANATTIECSDQGCVEFHYNFGVMTIVFTLLPSVYTVSAFMGPDKAPHMGLLYSVLSGLLWVTLDIAGVWSGSVTAAVIGHFVFWQAWSLLGVSVLAGARYGGYNDNCCGNFGR